MPAPGCPKKHSNLTNLWSEREEMAALKMIFGCGLQAANRPAAVAAEEMKICVIKELFVLKQNRKTRRRHRGAL